MIAKTLPLYALSCAVTTSAVAAIFTDVSKTHLPVDQLQARTMDLQFADFDGDGDLDVLLAIEMMPNLLLVNDGSGRFTVANQLPVNAHDSEDIGLADFDGDGDLDAVVVSEDDFKNELYLNDGNGVFADASNRLPLEGITNGVAVLDLDNDGDSDIVLGNYGQNYALLNDGSGNFSDGTASVLPAREDMTQDLEAGDIDGDGDLDLIVGNEDANRVLINDGNGSFLDETEQRLPLRATLEETREVALGDIDGDGDLDLFFANSRFTDRENGDSSNRLLVNDGTGVFVDKSADHLPVDTDMNAEGDFIDVDGDGDLDIVTGAFDEGAEAGNAPFRVYRNHGNGSFEDATLTVFPESAVGNGFDVEAADVNGDGHLDLYLANRWGSDILLIRLAE